VDLTNNGIDKHYLIDVDHGSTVSSTSQDRILHVHVRLEVFSRTQWERILFVSYETSGFDHVPNITQSSTIDTETLGLSITGEKYTVDSR
jgi:hypothetical protein